jgi:hypothetical protein
MRTELLTNWGCVATESAWILGPILAKFRIAPFPFMRLCFSLCFLCVAWCTQADQRAQSSAIGLNPVALAFARQLIGEGRVVLDKKGAWKRDEPSIAQKNEFIRSRGFEEYAKWRLGIDERHRADA